MRLWSLHPKYLDAKGLVALWREALLAQKVLQDKTRGYRNHPQLIRFKEARNTQGVIASYLRAVVEEADNRGYAFDRYKIANRRSTQKILVTRGQVDYEFKHLMQKLKIRDHEQFARLKKIRKIYLNPVFEKREGGLEPWEVV